MKPSDKDIADARAWLHIHGLGGVSFGPLATLIARVRAEERQFCLNEARAIKDDFSKHDCHSEADAIQDAIDAIQSLASRQTSPSEPTEVRG